MTKWEAFFTDSQNNLYHYTGAGSAFQKRKSAIVQRFLDERQMSVIEQATFSPGFGRVIIQRPTYRTYKESGQTLGNIFYQLYLHDRHTGKRQALFPQIYFTGQVHIVWSATGHTALIHGDKGTFLLRGSKMVSLPVTSPFNNFYWHPDGRKLLVYATSTPPGYTPPFATFRYQVIFVEAKRIRVMPCTASEVQAIFGETLLQALSLSRRLRPESDPEYFIRPDGKAAVVRGLIKSKYPLRPDVAWNSDVHSEFLITPGKTKKHLFPTKDFVHYVYWCADNRHIVGQRCGLSYEDDPSWLGEVVLVNGETHQYKRLFMPEKEHRLNAFRFLP